MESEVVEVKPTVSTVKTAIIAYAEVNHPSWKRAVLTVRDNDGTVTEMLIRSDITSDR